VIERGASVGIGVAFSYAKYVNQVRAGFASTLEDGMSTIADALVRAERSIRRGEIRTSVTGCQPKDGEYVG
jgi:hypothetical protein